MSNSRAPHQINILRHGGTNPPSTPRRRTAYYYGISFLLQKVAYGVIFLFSLTNVLFGNQSTFLYVNFPLEWGGMFSAFNYVCGVLYEYEQNSYAGIQVDFEADGFYFDARHGPNWWNYYCEPIYLGEKNGAILRRFTADEYIQFSSFTEMKLDRPSVFQLIQKYIRILEPVQKKVDQFIQDHFDDSYIICVHYRGTDKSIEAPRIGYEVVSNFVKQYIADEQLEHYKIFVATDEAHFLSHMRFCFPNAVCATNARRSKNLHPIHPTTHLQSGYEKGEEALIDCLLLSKGDVLIRTNSNLSLWASYFNPKIPVFELNHRYTLSK